MGSLSIKTINRYQIINGRALNTFCAATRIVREIEFGTVSIRNSCLSEENAESDLLKRTGDN